MKWTDTTYSYIPNLNDNVHWFKSALLLAKDDEVVLNVTAKAGAFPAWGDIYMSDGTSWYESDGTLLAYYTIAITLGAHTTVTIVDSDGNAYVNGSRVKSGATLTITAAAAAGYTLTTYTVNTVDKTASNPTTHVAAADVAIVTAATAE